MDHPRFTPARPAFRCLAAAAALLLAACATPAGGPGAKPGPGSSRGQAQTKPNPPAAAAKPNGKALQWQALLGTWRLSAIKTGNPALDRELLADTSVRYHFAANGLGWYQNQAGRHEFLWEHAEPPLPEFLRLRFKTDYIERYDSLKSSDGGRSLLLEGRFDMDFDNRPETVSLTLRKLP